MRLPHVRFTVRRMMFAVTVVATALVRIELATLLLILAVSRLAIRSLLAGPTTGRRSRPWAIPYLVTLACLYLPFGWVLWDAPSGRVMRGVFFEDFRWAWFKSWPVLPAFFALFSVNLSMSILSDNPFYSNVIALTAAAGSLLLIATFTSLGRLGRAPMVVANAIALLGSSLQLLFAYQLYKGVWMPCLPVGGGPAWPFMAVFLSIPLSGALSVGFVLVIATLWKRMKSREPGPAPWLKRRAREYHGRIF